MSKQFFWPKIFITNILCANVYKMYECDNNQMPYCNIKSFKNQIYENFGPLMEHGPHWINFIILILIMKIIDILETYIKFGTKLFHLS
jgi:hypothetical protein